MPTQSITPEMKLYMRRVEEILPSPYFSDHPGYSRVEIQEILDRKYPDAPKKDLNNVMLKLRRAHRIAPRSCATVYRYARSTADLPSVKAAVDDDAGTVALNFVSQYPDCTLIELASKASLAATTIRRGLDRLECSGLVTAYGPRGDRRFTRVGRAPKPGHEKVRAPEPVPHLDTIRTNEESRRIQWNLERRHVLIEAVRSLEPIAEFLTNEGGVNNYYAKLAAYLDKTLPGITSTTVEHAVKNARRRVGQFRYLNDLDEASLPELLHRTNNGIDDDEAQPATREAESEPAAMTTSLETIAAALGAINETLQHLTTLGTELLAREKLQQPSPGPISRPDEKVLRL